MLLLLLSAGAHDAWAQEADDAPGPTPSLTAPPPPPPDALRTAPTVPAPSPDSAPAAERIPPRSTVSARGPGMRVVGELVGGLVGELGFAYAGALLGSTFFDGGDALSRTLGAGLGLTVGAFLGSAFGVAVGGVLSGGGNLYTGAIAGAALGSVAMVLVAIPLLVALGPLAAVLLAFPLAGAMIGYERTQQLAAPWRSLGSPREPAVAPGLLALDRALGFSARF